MNVYIIRIKNYVDATEKVKKINKIGWVTYFYEQILVFFYVHKKNFRFGSSYPFSKWNLCFFPFRIFFYITFSLFWYFYIFVLTRCGTTTSFFRYCVNPYKKKKSCTGRASNLPRFLKESTRVLKYESTRFLVNKYVHTYATNVSVLYALKNYPEFNKTRKWKTAKNIQHFIKNMKRSAAMYIKPFPITTATNYEKNLIWKQNTVKVLLIRKKTPLK